MKKREKTILIGSFVLIFLLFLSPLMIAQAIIPASVISNGGERQSNSNYILEGTLGQVGIDVLNSINNILEPGFWNVYYYNTILGVEDQDNTLPADYKLEQNFPNPFNPSTVIKFAVPERSMVTVKIYDILGSELQTLANEELDAGWYEKVFDASGYTSGMYIYRIQAGNFVSTKKMLLLK